MILFEITFFLLYSTFAIVSFAGLGQLVIGKFDKGFIISLFFGFLFAAFLITIIHFVIEINLYVALTIMLLGFLWSLKSFVYFRRYFNREFIIYSLIFFILLPIYVSQKYHEDFGYYHLPYIINIINEKIIFGLANINRAFVHNSIWLNILPIFYIKDNYNYVMIPTFLIYYSFIIFSISQVIKNENFKISSLILIISSFYLILKFTRISEFGNDIPSLIFSILSIYYFLKFYEENNKDLKNKFFFYNLSFATFAILIKFSSIPLLILTIYLFIENFLLLKKNVFKFHYVLIYMLGCLFFFQQFIYTGCFIFPSKLSCIDVSWFDPNSLNAKYRLELINKSYFYKAKDFLSAQEYLQNLNWIPFWFERNYIGILEHLATMIIPAILFIFLLKKNKKKKLFIPLKIKAFVIFVLLGFIFWFSFSPVYRFGIIYFVCLVFLLSLLIYKNKSFSKKVFLNLIFIFLFFNFSKNTARIIDKNDIFFGITKIQNTFIENSSAQNNFVEVYEPDINSNNKRGNGWQGRLCWDIKFICTRNKIKVKKVKDYLFIEKL